MRIAQIQLKLEQRKLDTCEVIFAVLALQPGGALKIKQFLFSSINDARDSLNAVAAMTQREFFETVSGIVRPPSGKPNPKKVFPLY